MTDFLYFVFIFPLESLLGFVLGALFNFTKNEAASIILLSLLVNLFLLKIFIWSDKKAKIETERKKKFEARISRWKSVYAAPKVFAFTQTLYRQNHYHPIFALTALGGLAIQIPFFLAMIFLIQNGTALPSAEFETISVLDSALRIHVLPVLMTAITLANVFLSSNEKSARIQGAIIAILFLVLLYEMPHALVLYWTTNMAFSLCRAVWNKFKTPKPPTPKTTPPEIPKIQKTLRPSPHAFKIAHIAFALLCVLGVVAFALGSTVFAENLSFLQRAGTYFTLLTAIAFLYFLILAWRKNKYSATDSQGFAQISKYAIFNIVFLICVFTPYALYGSDISQFHPSFTLPTLSALFGAFLLISFLLIYAIQFAPQKTQWALAFLLSLLLGIGIWDSFIFTGNYGTMDRFIMNPIVPTIETRFTHNATRCFSLLVSALLVYFFFFKLKTILKIAFLTIFIVAFLNAFSILNARFEANQTFAQYTAQTSKTGRGGGGTL